MLEDEERPLDWTLESGCTLTVTPTMIASIWGLALDTKLTSETYL